MLSPPGAVRRYDAEMRVDLRQRRTWYSETSSDPIPDIVYRNPSQRINEHPGAYELGFQPKDPNASYNVAYHISHGNKVNTQYISTTRSLEIALKNQVPGTPTYIIDLNLVPGSKYDFTDLTMVEAYLKNPYTRNLAVRAREVTIEGAIPPDAIIGMIELFD